MKINVLLCGMDSTKYIHLAALGCIFFLTDFGLRKISHFCVAARN